MSNRQVKQEMAELKSTIYRMWIDGKRGNDETIEQKSRRHELTSRWYELRASIR